MFDPTTAVGLHTIASLIALGAGLILVRGMLASNPMPFMAGVFFLTMLYTDVSGFLLPAPGFLPSHATGILSLVALAIAIPARYQFGYAGSWRWLYVVSTVLAVWLNTFVAVVQAFGKIPALNRLAPTQAEPPFAIAQLAVLLLFILLGYLAVRRYRPAR